MDYWALFKSGIKISPLQLKSLVVVVLIVGMLGVFYAASLIRQPARATSLSTWEQWGMSIQYPARLETVYGQLLEEKATANSGFAMWIWNYNATCLSIMWTPLVHINWTAGYESIKMVQHNVTIIDQGNFAIAGKVWEYQTYQWIVNGHTQYSTYAGCECPESNRTYFVIFSDTYSDTLDSLVYYGNTFTG